MNLKELTNITNSCRKSYRNWISVLIQLFMERTASKDKDVNIKVSLRDGKTIRIPYGWVTSYARLSKINNNNISNLELTINGLSFSYKERKIILDPARFSDLDAVFFHEEYKFLNVTNKDVIDIGTNIGDSAIYFLINGARRVIALEPYPYAFSVAERNVKLNNMSDIILINSGYGEDSKMTVSEKISNNASSLSASLNGKEIYILSLKTLIDKYNIENCVIKMDCEGCEYALLSELDEVYKNIAMIQIEYHYGYENLVKKLLDVGFDVKYTNPRKYYNNEADNKKMELGYIYAIKPT